MKKPTKFFYLHLFKKTNDSVGSKILVNWLSRVTDYYFVQTITTTPGGRDLVAGLLPHFPPSNFFPFLMSITAGISALNGELIRELTEKQFPTVSLSDSNQI